MLHKITFTLLIIGGLNWLAFGLLGMEIGSYLPDGMNGMVARTVYNLVGIAALYEIATHKKWCKACDSGMKKM